MRIKTDDSSFWLPEKPSINLLIDNGNKGYLLDCLNSYFTQMKKNKCIIIDDFDSAIPMDKVSFIYVSKGQSIDNNFIFKPKSMLNQYFVEIIDSNMSMFQSLEKIREEYHNLLSDSGMFRFVKLLKENIKTDINIESDLTTQKLVQQLYIDTDELTIEQQYMIIYNLLIYVNKDSLIIAYIDFDVTSEAFAWLNSISKNKNIIILIDNEALIDYSIDFSLLNLIVLHDNYKKVDITINNETMKRISYFAHPILRNNFKYIFDKKIDIIDYLNGKETYFFQNNDYSNYLKDL